MFSWCGKWSLHKRPNSAKIGLRESYSTSDTHGITGITNSMAKVATLLFGTDTCLCKIRGPSEMADLSKDGRSIWGAPSDIEPLKPSALYIIYILYHIRFSTKTNNSPFQRPLQRQPLWIWSPRPDLRISATQATRAGDSFHGSRSKTGRSPILRWSIEHPDLFHSVLMCGVFIFLMIAKTPSKPPAHPTTASPHSSPPVEGARDAQWHL